jgi:hypothetical protein
MRQVKCLIAKELEILVKLDARFIHPNRRWVRNHQVDGWDAVGLVAFTPNDPKGQSQAAITFKRG